MVNISNINVNKNSTKTQISGHEVVKFTKNNNQYDLKPIQTKNIKKL